MDDPNQNEISSFKRFLETFCRDVKDPSSSGNESNVRYVSYKLEPSEIEGESLQWALDYLCQTHCCPPGLAEHVSREAFKRLSQLDKECDNSREESTQSPGPTRVEIRSLQREVETQVRQVCQEWNQHLPPRVRPPRPPLPRPMSFHAIKNTRRRMEDRHVILPDLNTLFNIQDSPAQSYYAVFDGHGGSEAAMFCASQLHVNLVRDVHFNARPELALRRAYATTDRQFLYKAEEQKLRSGTTGVNLLIRGDQCVVSWLGDSQVIVVRDGQAVNLMEPHKPNREDERRRIEDLGGSVTNNFGGVWRVNGSVSVSRAIGDLSMKPFLCSEADAVTFTLTGTEDYAVLGCDGLWDVVAPGDIPFLVHAHLQRNPGDLTSVAKHLVTTARDMGSGDNISVIVVFFRSAVAAPVGLGVEGLEGVVRENGDFPEDCSASQRSGSHFTSGASTISGSTSSTLSTINSAGLVSGPGDSYRRNSFNSASSLHAVVSGQPSSQVQADFPFKLERQTGFFLPGVRSLRTGHHRQQLVPLAEANQRARTLSEGGGGRETGEGAVTVGGGDTGSKSKAVVKAGARRAGGHSRRKVKTRGGRRRGRGLEKNSRGAESPDSSLPDSVSLDRSVGGRSAATSLSQLPPPPTQMSEPVARQASLAQVLQQMTGQPSDENRPPGTSSQPDGLSVRGLSAHLHKSLPRIPPHTPLTATTAMTPVATSRLAGPHDLPRPLPLSKGRSRPYNT